MKLENDLAHTKRNLSRQNSRFQKIVNNSMICIIILRHSKKDDSFRILEINQSLEKILEIEGQDNVGKILKDINPHFAKSKLCDLLKEVTTTKTTVIEREYKVTYPKDGRSFDAQIMHLDKNDYAIIQREVTTEIKQKQSLIQNNNELKAAMIKAQESERLKTAFLSNISHEIRTPMNAIFGFTGLLEQNHFSIEKRNEFIQLINRSCKRLLNTVNNVINISKIEAGLVSIHRTTFIIYNLLNDTVMLLKPEANEKNLSLNLITHSDELPNEIEPDEEKLNAVITGFVKNAFKYTKIGSIEVSANIESKNLHV